ncbi:hypothetical protein ACFJI1_08480 [Pseudoxanthomonas sp. UC29_72]
MRIDRALRRQGEHGARVELDAHVHQRQPQQRAVHQLRAPLRGLLVVRLADRGFLAADRLLAVALAGHGGIGQRRVAGGVLQQGSQVAVGPQALAPARRQRVQQQAIGRAGRIGEAAHIAAPVVVVLQRGDGRHGGIARVAEAPAGVFGQPLVDLQRVLAHGRVLEALPPPGAERQRIGDGRLALRAAAAQRLRQRAPFQPQADAPVELVQVLGQRRDGRWQARGLDAMERLVHQQFGAGLPVLRERQLQHRPALPGPFGRGVGDADVRRQLAHEHAAPPLQALPGHVAVHEQRARVALDQHDRAAQALAPQPRMVALAQHPVLGDGRRGGRCRIVMTVRGDRQRLYGEDAANAANAQPAKGTEHRTQMHR